MSLYFTQWGGACYNEDGTEKKIQTGDSSEPEVTETAPGTWAYYTPLSGELMQESLNALLENDLRLASEIPTTTYHSGYDAVGSVNVNASAVKYDGYNCNGYASVMFETPGTGAANSAWVGYTVPTPQQPDGLNNWSNRTKGILAVNSEGMYWANTPPVYSKNFTSNPVLQTTSQTDIICNNIKFPGPSSDGYNTCSAWGRISGNFKITFASETTSQITTTAKIGNAEIAVFNCPAGSSTFGVNLNTVIGTNVTSGDLTFNYDSGISHSVSKYGEVVVENCFG